MSSATFDKLVALLGPGLTFQDTRMRKSVPPEERLAVTLAVLQPATRIPLQPNHTETPNTHRTKKIRPMW